MVGAHPPADEVHPRQEGVIEQFPRRPALRDEAFGELDGHPVAVDDRLLERFVLRIHGAVASHVRLVVLARALVFPLDQCAEAACHVVGQRRDRVILQKLADALGICRAPVFAVVHRRLQRDTVTARARSSPIVNDLAVDS